MNFHNNSKYVLITGCSSGIGLDAAQTLNSLNWKVIATVRDENDSAPLKQLGIDVVILDYANSESVHKAQKEILNLCGEQLFAVIHNGAYGQSGAVEDLSREAISAQFNANVFGPIQLTQMLLPTFRKHDSGRIIFISSVLGLVAMPFRGAYIASKFAIEGFADTLRIELSKTSIDVVLIEPGPINTMFRKNAYIKFKEYIDWQNSVFFENYQSQINRLTKDKSDSIFALDASAVTKKICKALEANRPKPRYFVTVPTYLFAFLKWLLPTRFLDFILSRIV